MDAKQLEEIWEKILDEAFKKFAEEYLGYDPQTKEDTDCFGTGDNHTYCSRCWLQINC